MISDTLYQAISEIDVYLDSGTYGDGGALVSRITEVREQMRGLQALLDVPPQAYDEAGIDVGTVELSTVINMLKQAAAARQ